MTYIQSNIKPIIWQENKLLVLDQRLLPFEKKYLELTTYKLVIDAIKTMAVRGAPLIGICAGYGMALAAKEIVEAIPAKGPASTRRLGEAGEARQGRHELPLQIKKLKSVAEEIKDARPTAVNLGWAVDLILNDIANVGACHGAPLQDMVAKRAIWIHEDDAERCRKIGENGLSVIARRDIVPTKQSHFVTRQEIASSPLRAPRNDVSILTICNTGSLATGGIGTAFGVILTAHQKGIPIKVFASETRPRQQGARLTTFECIENGIDCTLISDTACGYLMQKGEIDLVITGADRIAANGDVANKIGTYQLAVLAGENNIPFYVAAPLSTFDLTIKSGDEIPIEEREREEVTQINDKPICIKEIRVRNPAFDITPAKYVSGIRTEKSIISGDYVKSIKQIFNEVAIV